LELEAILAIIFGCITALSVGASIGFGILNHKTAKRSNETALESTKIARDVYLTSIKPYLVVTCEMSNYPPITIIEDAMHTRTPDVHKFPQWWGHVPYLLVRNKGNGTAIDPKINLIHPNSETEINPKTTAIAKDDFYLIFLVNQSDKSTIKHGGSLVERYFEIIYVSDDKQNPQKIKKIELSCKNIDGDKLSFESVLHPFKLPRT